MASLQTVKTRAGDMLDAILWRNRGRTQGLVEETFALNPGLADLGPVLPAGVEIVLPAPAAAKPLRETVKLWG